ncbi:MAG: metallophosphoesterase [Firmicutes bacterium]|nr:metallophosphoesterase [Bacillota bacterium]HPZ90517.1 metallophosphoesterase [Bacillota bacterium]HQE02649.1 metallophosphoesterase [Bacillota bacterium]
MLLALGDSHRNRIALDKIAELIGTERPQLFVHTGDNFSDYKLLRKKTGIPGFGVRGNCDMGIIPGAKEELIFSYAGKQILLTHGHLYGVKYSLRDLHQRAEELGVDAVIFGHSHVALLERAGGIWLINPGSLSLPRRGSRPGFARIWVDEGEIKGELATL